MTPPRIIALLFVLLLVPCVRGALVFEKTTLTLSPATAPEHLDVEFPFKNEGDAPVTVREVTASCGCTVPALDKKTYAPGEKGVLKVRFDVGDRQGPQNRTVTLRTDTGGTQVLTLIVNLPVRSVIVPRLHFFRPPDVSDKVSTVTFYNDLPVTLESAVSSDPAFTVTSVTTERTNASNSGVPGPASLPSTIALIESVSLVKRTPPVCTLSWERSRSAVDAEPVNDTMSPSLRFSNRSGTPPDTSCRAPSGTSPVSTRMRTIASVRYAVGVAGLTSVGTPARNAGASFSSGPHTGKLNALICTAAPGRRV